MRRVTLDEVKAAICDREPSHYHDEQDWRMDCHSVSLAIVKSDLFPVARVARGACRGVWGQHSWVVIGEDCFAPTAQLLDCTLWSYDERHPVVWQGTYDDGLHRPHGWGSIWRWGRPAPGNDEPIALDGLSGQAQRFLDLCGPLDRTGWAHLFSAPLMGWPAREIVTAAYGDQRLRALIPIDVVGMVTDLNPSGLYLKGDAHG